MALPVRLSLALAAAALLGACGDTPAGQVLRGVLPAAGSGTAPAIAEPAPAAAEGPVLLLSAPRRVALGLVSEAGPRRLWRGEGNVAIATEGARVVGTAGLPRLLVSTRFEGPDPLDDPRALLGREASARRTVDLMGPDRDPGSMRFGVLLDCTLRGVAEARAIIVEERCTGEDLGFANRFWADPATGAVTRSEQWAGEGMGTLQIEAQGI